MSAAAGGPAPTGAGAAPPAYDGREAPPAVVVRALDLWYGDFHALRGVSLDVPARGVTALIGPSGCGKSTLLRCLDRMTDLVPGTRVRGRVHVGGLDVFAPDTDVEALRRRVGMVFQKPNPFPLDVFGNVAYGLRAAGVKGRGVLRARVERALRQVGLWAALGDRLDAPALALAPEQQQRLCIARMLATEPEVLLFDEPCSTLDPAATQTIETLLVTLARDRPVVIVTHSMQQARRIADTVAFLLLGELVEAGPTAQVVDAPRDPRTADYVAGRFG